MKLERTPGPPPPLRWPITVEQIYWYRPCFDGAQHFAQAFPQGAPDRAALEQYALGSLIGMQNVWWACNRAWLRLTDTLAFYWQFLAWVDRVDAALPEANWWFDRITPTQTSISPWQLQTFNPADCIWYLEIWGDLRRPSHPQHHLLIELNAYAVTIILTAFNLEES